jgi:ElaB/YqjD/DUF883 family membrane-anchored ribosome-binding protein
MVDILESSRIVLHRGRETADRLDVLIQAPKQFASGISIVNLKKEVAMPSYTGEQLIDDLRTVIREMEELLKALGSESKEKIAGVRPRVEAALLRAKARVAEMEAVVEARARGVVHDVDVYAHENPWKTAGVAAGMGAALGAIIGVLLARH